MSGSPLAAALRLLGRRAFFRAELGERLIGKGFEAGDVELALDRCSELGYLDDRAAAERFVELRAGEKGWGPRRLRAELARRGVDGELAAEVARLEGERLASALATAVRLIERRWPQRWWRVGRQRARMVSSLVSRGFDADDADAAVSRLAAERGTSDHAPHEQPGDPVDLP